jgi:hypothetical protein
VGTAVLLVLAVSGVVRTDSAAAAGIGIGPSAPASQTCASGTSTEAVPGLGSAPTADIPCPGAPPASPDPCLVTLPDLCVQPTGTESPAEAAVGDGEASTQSPGSWRTVDSPNASAEPNILTGVSCLSASDCWAVGRARSGLAATVTMHWDGSSWRTLPSPNVKDVLANILADVTCASPSDCWAVGSYITNDVQVRSLIMRWDGAAWRIVDSPDIGTKQ